MSQVTSTVLTAGLLLGMASLGCAANDGTSVSPAPEPAPTGCAGTLSGYYPGKFTCRVTAAFYPMGTGLTNSAADSLVTVISDRADQGLRLPDGVQSLGSHVQVTGEVRPGQFDLSDTVPTATLPYVLYGETYGIFYNKVVSLRLVITEATLLREEIVPSVDIASNGRPARIYEVHGTFEYGVRTDGAPVIAEVATAF